MHQCQQLFRGVGNVHITASHRLRKQPFKLVYGNQEADTHHPKAISDTFMGDLMVEKEKKVAGMFRRGRNQPPKGGGLPPRLGTRRSRSAEFWPGVACMSVSTWPASMSRLAWSILGSGGQAGGRGVGRFVTFVRQRQIDVRLRRFRATWRCRLLAPDGSPFSWDHGHLVTSVG